MFLATRLASATNGDPYTGGAQQYGYTTPTPPSIGQSSLPGTISTSGSAMTQGQTASHTLAQSIGVGAIGIMGAFVVIGMIAVFVLTWRGMCEQEMFDFMPAAATAYTTIMTAAMGIAVSMLNGVTGYPGIAWPLIAALLVGLVSHRIVTNTIDGTIRAIENNKVRRLVIRRLSLRDLTFNLLGRKVTSFEEELAKVLDARRGDKLIKEAVGSGNGITG